MEWCWIIPTYKCQDSADFNILNQGEKEFLWNPNRAWEYKANGRGKDTDDNKLFETDCYYLVDSSLKLAGYKGLGQTGNRKADIDNGNVIVEPYFCPVEVENARAGDVIIFQGADKENPWAIRPGHIALLAQAPTKNVDGITTFTLFEASRIVGGAKLGRQVTIYDRTEVEYHDENGTPIGSGTVVLTFFGIYRPKRWSWGVVCYAPNRPPDQPLFQYHGDPLMLDAQGHGARKSLVIAAQDRVHERVHTENGDSDKQCCQSSKEWYGDELRVA